MNFAQHGPGYLSLPYEALFDDGDIVLKGRSLELGRAEVSRLNGILMRDIMVRGGVV